MSRWFFSTFNNGEKYSRDNTENLTQLIQIEISEKAKLFGPIFFADLKST